MVHYHGTPITPRSMLPELAGRHFCVSFSDPRDIKIVHEIGQMVMLDNGAYSFWRDGKPTDWPAYYTWCYKWLAYQTTWAVIPDVIDGDENTNDQLIEEWPFGYRGAPVWHMHESLTRLLRLCEEWPRVCIGSSGQYSDMTTSRWRRRMAAAMDTACIDGRPITWLHLMRGLAFAGSDYPLSSADSTNIARNHAGSPTAGRPPKLVREMADQIDSLQCPCHWHHKPPQLEMALQGVEGADDVSCPPEPRRYRAEMPQAAWKRGAPPLERSRRSQAMNDLAEGLDRYLRPPETQYSSSLCEFNHLHP